MAIEIVSKDKACTKDSFCNVLLNESDRVKVIKGWAFDDIIGYVPTKINVFIPTFPSVEHEIAHVVQMNDFSRLVKVDFGLFMPEKMLRHKLTNKQYIVATAREIVVKAIQEIIEGKTNTRIKNNEAWNQFFEKIRYSRFKSTKDFYDWEEDLHTKTLKAWSKDRIFVEWKKRLDYIHNWMETK